MTMTSPLPIVSPTAFRASGFAVPLVLGPLRGFYWDLNSGGKLTRHLLGTYEREQTQWFERLVRPGQQVLDIGANTGYYSLLAARLVTTAGRVVSFEPDPQNLVYLQNHVLRNRLGQVIVLPFALGNESASAAFGGGTGTGTRRLCADGACQVQVRRLVDLAAEFHLAPYHMKIDVEGHELAVLQGGSELIRRFRPTVFLSTHEGIVPGVHRDCCGLLRSWGYELQPLGRNSVETATELLCRYPPA